MTKPHRVVDYYEHWAQIDRLVKERDEARARIAELEAESANWEKIAKGKASELGRCKGRVAELEDAINVVYISYQAGADYHRLCDEIHEYFGALAKEIPAEAPDD